jgi:PAS domain S-box-containing protein
MNFAEFQLRGQNDPRLAVHAASPLPAWLWSADGTRIIWANAAGAGVFGATDAAELADKKFGPADPHRRQVAQLSTRLPANGRLRMERLRGFGATLGMLSTCGCFRFDFPDGSHGVLVVAAKFSGRMLPRATPKKSAPASSDTTPPLPADKQPAPSGEAPAAFALFDALAEEDAAPPAAEPRAAVEQERFDPQPALQIDVPHVEASPGEPSPYVEPVADEPATDAGVPAAALAGFDDTSDRRLHPLRFLWQSDKAGRFSLGSDEFIRLIGPRAAAAFGRPWRDIALDFGIDQDGRLAQALARHESWSGIAQNWPVEGGWLPVELSGVPVFDNEGKFAGHRGFGVCPDLAALTRLDTLRRLPGGTSTPPPSSADIVQAGPSGDSTAPDIPADASVTPSSSPGIPTSILSENSPQTDLDTPVETPQEPLQEVLEAPIAQAAAEREPPRNVLPFRPIGEVKPPALTPVENSAFNELARQLSARLDDNGNGTDGAVTATTESTEPLVEAPPPPAAPEPASDTPDWLAPPEPPARGVAKRDKALLDLLPDGVLIYRLDRLLYANPAFLRRIGYASLQALEEAGGLDALYVEPGVSTASSTSEAGKPVTISASHVSEKGVATSDDKLPATDARLYTISWDDESALALICSGATPEATAIPAALAEAVPVPADAPPQAGQADAEELAAILDTTAEGILMFDAEGNINSCNRSAEALFGYDGEALVERNLFDLFAPESQRAVMDYLESIKSSDISSLLDHGRDALGRVNNGGIIPLSVTMGRTRADGPNFFAVFRDLSQMRKSENELLQARRLTERAANAKADMLARISHAVRTPLNAIIGFAEVMIGERFGKLGNERYAEYLKDIRASGERVIAIIDDLNDLSRIETGKLDLAFASQNLNELVENCVAVMQPHANRERIIIRTSLAHTLPPVVADARALRQIALNLIGSSIHLAKAGGQVIVSTALSDFGEVMLRVRDTGQALNDNEVAAAMEPFRTLGPSDQAADGAAVSLSLTKALVEANRAKFHIKPGPHSGTLIEVVFSRAVARA